ncbi:ABC-F family ATP-binding cassette domain-containing protein [Desulfobotulus mexicanus]|uniref:ABC-F family ATP-binding cassette domain-containing protein n=1 Tax=Desulfobotulus mexicanus TaxID=2586642 RepID=A0A5Q4VCV7_9BACT|nr:ABC-F family ATP-binding cassette domain-containing protein [Desulfobotulus mexicanus]TYT75544.1 ABC-F family ATP-binding cassette domain-containing protein [Desulfobotulus mexicanus]
MIQIDHLKKSYGSQDIFDGVGFKINSRERIGLVGRNGHGKTTLLRILSGEELPDEGQILMPKNYRIGYVSQHLSFSESSILDEVASGLPAEEKDAVWKAEKILAGLGFSEKDMASSPDVFSGGFQIRVHLAKVIVSEPDLLLLDEPTNYLDITSIRWMERFLSAWPRELLLITHDRSFMDKVVTHVVGIHRKRIRKVAGDTEKYYMQMAQEEEVYEKTRVNDEKRRREMEQFIRRFRAKARLAGMVQSRVKALGKMEKKDKLENIKDLEFSFPYLSYKGKNMLQASGISFGYGSQPPLIQNFSLTLSAGERVCIVGKNGKGKTTLLQLLAQIAEPSEGKISLNPGIETGIYEQTHISRLHPERSVEEEIQAAHGDCERQMARNICGAMMFEGDQALKPIRILSGGEKSRVMLGRLLIKPHNLLFLDEPTNHLDMNSCDALLEAIDAFEGTVVMVTHNEMFLHALADRLVVFKENGPVVFDGGYGDFLQNEGWDEENEEQGSMGKSSVVSSAVSGAEKNTPSRKDLRKMRSEIIQQKSLLLKPVEKKMALLEKDIEISEEKLQNLTLEMQDLALTGDGLKMATVAKEIGLLQSKIDTLYLTLEEETISYETIKADFDLKIANLDLCTA